MNTVKHQNIKNLIYNSVKEDLNLQVTLKYY